MNTHALLLLSLLMLPAPAWVRADAPAPPPLPPTPRRGWEVEAYLSPAQDSDAFVLRLEKDPRALFTYTVDPQKVTGTVLNAAGRVVPSQGASFSLSPVPLYRTPPRRPDPPAMGVTWLNVQWHTDGLAPNLYTLKVSAPVQATDTATGKPVSLPPASASATLYLPPAPDKPPALAVGQRFLCLPDDADPLPYTDAHGQTPPLSTVSLKTWTLTGASGKTLTFTVEGRPGPLALTTTGKDVFSQADVSLLPGLVPLVEDNTLRRLRARYEGRQVWGYGGVGAQFPPTPGGGVDGFSATSSEPVTIVRLVRLALPNVTLAMGGQLGAMGGDRQSEFSTRNPLLVVLGLPRGLQVTSASGSGAASAQAMQGVMGSQPTHRAGYLEYADAWDFERAYSLVAWRKQHADWPRTMQNAVKKGELRKGMTPEMAAWVSGFPAEYGTKAQLLARAKLPKAAWRYDNLSPFSFWIYFHAGRVVSFGTDGELP